MPTLTGEMAEKCRSVAASYGVAHEIHAEDFIFWHLHDALSSDRQHEAIEDYFRSGAASAVWIKSIVDTLPGLPPSFSFLDFASGYGRVARHLPRILPAAQLVTSDVHPQAVAFNRSINLDAIGSTFIPEDFDPGRDFDVICAISFFTHMPQKTWGRWLRTLGKFLKPHGMLIFTTHGRVALGPTGVMNVPPSGFAFHPASEQKDLAITEYAATITLFEYVVREVANADLRICWFKEAGAGYQDLIVVKRLVEDA